MPFDSISLTLDFSRPYLNTAEDTVKRDISKCVNNVGGLIEDI